MENSDFVLFIYDTKVVQREEDDQVLAIKYFSPLNYETNKKCSLCGNLVAMYQGIERVTGAVPTFMSLRTLKFEIMKLEDHLFVALGSKASAPKNLRKNLQDLIEIITLKYSSVTAMIERWKKLEIEEDLMAMLHMIHPLVKLEIAFDLQMKSLLLTENFAKQGSFYGLALFYGDKLIHSQLDSELTLKLWLSKWFADDVNAAECTEHSIIRRYSVFLEENSLKRLRFQNNLKVRKEHSLKQKTRKSKMFDASKQHFHYSSTPPDDRNETADVCKGPKLVEITLVVIQASEAWILLLSDEDNLDLELMKTWEKTLLQLDEQLESNVPQRSETDPNF